MHFLQVDLHRILCVIAVAFLFFGDQLMTAKKYNKTNLLRIVLILCSQSKFKIKLFFSFSLPSVHLPRDKPLLTCFFFFRTNPLKTGTFFTVSAPPDLLRHRLPVPQLLRPAALYLYSPAQERLLDVLRMRTTTMPHLRLSALPQYLTTMM